MITTENGHRIIKMPYAQYFEIDEILHEGDDNNEGLIIECDYSLNAIKEDLDALKEQANNITTYSDNVYLRDKINIIERNLRSKVEKLENQHNQVVNILNYFI